MSYSILNYAHHRHWLENLPCDGLIGLARLGDQLVAEKEHPEHANHKLHVALQDVLSYGDFPPGVVQGAKDAVDAVGPVGIAVISKGIVQKRDRRKIVPIPHAKEAYDLIRSADPYYGGLAPKVSPAVPHVPVSSRKPHEAGMSGRWNHP